MKKKLFCALAALFALMTFAYAADELLVAPTFGQTEARSMLDMVNAFRTGDEAYCWNESNTAQVPSKGEPLTYSYALEEIAMQRAAEIALSFSHTRPDGTSCFSATASDGTRSYGENIAAGSSTANGAFTQWREDDENYSGQGHRRNMLSQDFAAIGIGHVVLNGTHYWTQEFSYDTDSASATTAVDAARSVTIEAASGQMQSVGDLTAEKSEMTLQAGESASLPTVSVSVTLADAWPGGATTVNVNPVWTSGDASVCAVDGQEVSGASAGTAVLTGAALGKTVAVSVTVGGGSGGNGQDNPPVADGVYAILYEDGTLVFQNGNAPEAGRAVTKTYEVDLDAIYDWRTSAPWYEERESIFVVSFAEKISPTSTARWFYQCSKLERIDGMENLDTSNVTDMNRMFVGCSELKELDVSGWNTANVTDMSGMFGSCKSLTALDLSHFDASKVTNMEGMFSSCGVEELNVSGWNTASVTDMRSVFAYCKSLTELDLSGWNTASATEMGSMFSSCKSLTALDLSHFDVSNVTDMWGMFGGCDALTELNVSGWNVASVTNMSQMFYNCGALKSLDVSGWNTASVTNMSDMFVWCRALTELDVSGWNTANVTNMDNLFVGCTGLKKLDVSGWNTANVTDMGGMFGSCAALTELDVSGWDTANVTNMRHMFSGDPEYPLPLNKLDVSGWKTDSVTDMSFMFYNCYALTELDVSGWNTANVTNMSRMFSGCNRLTELDLSGWNTANVTGMVSMFGGCAALTALDASGWDTANVTDMRGMFSGCAALTELDLSGWDTANVTDMSWMFYECYALKTIRASDKFTTASLPDGQSMFYECRALVGGNGTEFDKGHADKEYARIDAPDAPGYFTAKDAPAYVPYAISAAAPDTDAGTLSVTLSNPGAATVAVSYFDANGKFVSAQTQKVEANGKTAALALSADAKKARVILFDGECRPLCACFETPIG